MTNVLGNDGTSIERSIHIFEREEISQIRWSIQEFFRAPPVRVDVVVYVFFLFFRLYLVLKLHIVEFRSVLGLLYFVVDLLLLQVVILVEHQLVALVQVHPGSISITPE